MNPFVGTIILFAGDFAPEGWLFCDGAELENAFGQGVLYSVIGTNYGGTITTFKLPDLRGRVPLGAGTGPGLLPHELGQSGGQEVHRLTTPEMPSHNHSTSNSVSEDQHIQLSATVAVDEALVAGDVPAEAQFKSGVSATNVKSFGPATNVIKGQAINSTDGLTILNSGSSFPHNNMQPFLGLNYIICVAGLYPQRS